VLICKTGSTSVNGFDSRSCTPSDRLLRGRRVDHEMGLNKGEEVDENRLFGTMVHLPPFFMHRRVFRPSSMFFKEHWKISPCCCQNKEAQSPVIVPKYPVLMIQFLLEFKCCLRNAAHSARFKSRGQRPGAYGVGRQNLHADAQSLFFRAHTCTRTKAKTSAYLQPRETVSDRARVKHRHQGVA